VQDPALITQMVTGNRQTMSAQLQNNSYMGIGGQTINGSPLGNDYFNYGRNYGVN